MAWGKKTPYEIWLEEQQKLYDMTPEQTAALKEGDKLYGKKLSPYFPQALENQQAVKKRAMESMFEAAQQGARQSFFKGGEPFSMSRYKDTSMLPARGSPKSDPARLQASPVGYDEKEWWRQDPYRPVQAENFSIFSMKPYSW